MQIRGSTNTLMPLDKKIIFVSFQCIYSYFESDELRMLLSILRDEKLCPKKNFTKFIEETVTPIDLDKKKNFDMFELNASAFVDQFNKHDTFKVDFETFRLLLNELTEWGKCQSIDLAEKLFRVS